MDCAAAFCLNFFKPAKYSFNTVVFPQDTHMLQTAHIINILNVFDKEYSNAQIYWALPFQILYEQVKGRTVRGAKWYFFFLLIYFNFYN